MENTADENKRLRSCINDLISVLALPAIWSGSESSHIVGTLLDVLLAMLRLDFACARLSDSSDGPQIEVVRWGHRQHPPVQPQQVTHALDRWLTGDQASSRLVIRDPAGEAEVSIASFSLGLQHEVGVLAVGSRRADFPTEVERLLLRVAANQAAIGLQEALRSGGQKRVAEALEQRVAERTRQLTAVNQELRRSQAYLADAQRLSRTGSFGWRISTGEILWSDETFRIFQYDRATTPTVERVLERVHPDDVALVRQTIERASQDGKDFALAHRLVMPDGSVKYVRVVAHAVSDESASIEFIGAVMDVTAAQESEDRIRQNESELRITIETIPAFVVSRLPDGAIDFVSQSWLDYAGCSREKVLDLDWMKITHPEDLDRVVNNWRAALVAGEAVEQEARYRRADGKYRWFLDRAVPLRDQKGNIVKWYSTLHDIEEGKRAAEALRRSEEQWRDVFENNPTMYFMVDATGQVMAVNPFGAEQLGYNVDELVGQPVLGVFHESDREAVQRHVASCLEQLGRATSWEARKVRKDGTLLWVRETAKAVPRVNGPIVLVAGEDMTEQKRAEEALRQAQADLAHVSRVTTLGEMAASIAHEVDQPLSGVVINANACLRFLTGASPNLDEVRDGLHAIARDGRRAGDVIGRIRTLARRTATEKQAVDINEVIREVVGLAQGEAQRTRGRIRTELASDLPRVVGDPVQLQQVVLNLLLNGLDAMHAVVGRPRELVIRTQREAIDRVRVAVQDSGSGIDPQLADRIFDAFYTTKRGGLGMGLSISRSIVEQHGGRLWAVPNDGSGTTFHFTV